MNENRVNEIKKHFTDAGLTFHQTYDNEELLKYLETYQNVLAQCVFAKLHAEHLRARDVMTHFETMAKEYDVENMDEYRRFTKNMTELQRTIRCLKNGRRGEKNAEKALGLIRFEKDVEILKNIEVQDGSNRTEYDEIVISPKGITVIEVKSFNYDTRLTKEGNLVSCDGYKAQKHNYNLGEKMNVKEYLIRKLVSEKLAQRGVEIPFEYQGIVLYANNDSVLTDEYGQLAICYCSTISKYIRDNCCQGTLTKEQIQILKEVIEEMHTPQKYACRIDCEKLTEDFALLMAKIEELADERNNKECDVDNGSEENKKHFNWKRFGICAAIVGGVATGTGAFIFNRSR